MMTKKRLCLILLVLFLACGLLAWAAKEEQESNDRKPEVIKAPNEDMPERSVQRRGPFEDPSMLRRRPEGIERPVPQGNREEVYRERMRNQEMAHKELVDELIEIKKIAEEEGASKTAEAIQKMIDKREQQYKLRIEEAQRRRLEMQKRIQERMKEREQRIERQAAEKEPQKQTGTQSGEENPAEPKKEKK